MLMIPDSLAEPQRAKLNKHYCVFTVLVGQQVQSPQLFFFFFFCLQASSNLIPSEDESRIMLLLKQVESLIFCLTDVSVLRLQNYTEQHFPIF